MKDGKASSPQTITISSAAQLLLWERFQAFHEEVNSAARNAPYGQVLERTEEVVLLAGREFLRQTLEQTLQEQAKACPQKLRHRGYRSKRVVTAAGEVTLKRRRSECISGLHWEGPNDEWLGLDGRYSRGTRRMLSLAGASWSFDHAAKFIQEFCGVAVSDNTIRERCQQEAVKIAEWQRTDEAVGKEFSESYGEVEFMTDGTGVNTTEGWREMKVALFSQRELGKRALPAEWESRHLPKPHIKWGFAGIAPMDSFRRHWRQRANWLRIHLPHLSVLADGAHSIWEAVSFVAGVLELSS